MKTYIGIDVSKDSLSVAYPNSNSGFDVKAFSNDVAGIEQLINSLPAESWCILEATGVYSRLLCYELVEKEIALSLLNPKQSSAFSKIQMSISKNDNQDAILLARYGQQLQPPQWKPQSNNVILMKQKRTLIDQFTKQKTALGNIKHAINFDVVQDQTALNCLNESLEHWEAQIQKLEKEICDMSETDFKKYYDLLLSVVGIGPKIATSIIVLTGGFTLFESAKQFIKFIGIAPTVFQSGTSVKANAHISRTGQTALRNKLFVAAKSALKGNKACKALFDRLKAKGKSGKVALIAVAHKIVRQAFGVAFSGVPFDNNFQTI